MKTYINVDGVLCKETQEEITKEEVTQFTDDFLEFIENKGYTFGGAFICETEEECEERLNKS